MRDRLHWARLLAFVTGLVNQELLLRNEYLIPENRILRGHLPNRLQLPDPARPRSGFFGKIEAVGVRFAPENRGWGYDRISDALAD
jgi:hypothetical protein